MQFAKLISFIFHPIIVPIASALLYFILIPNHIPKNITYYILGLIFITTYILPVVLLFILKKTQLIEDFHLKTIDERKFPIIFFTILSFLIGRLLLKPAIVDVLGYSFIAISISMLVVYLLFFLKIKTSLHTLAIAGQIGFITIISYHYKNNLLVLLVFLFLLLGIIGSSRLKLKAHTSLEVLLGFFIGFLPQFILYSYYTY